MDAPTQIPAGWYQDPQNADVSMRRWWTGYAWTEQMAQVPLESQPALGDSAAPVVFDKKKHNVLVATGVFEVLIGLIFLSYFVLRPPVFFAFCEFAVAVTTLVLEINAVRIRKRSESIGIGRTIVQLVMGVLGVAWFLLVIADAIFIFMTQNPRGF